MGLKMLSNRLDSTRIERLVTVDVTRHTESQLMTSRVDPCESRRFVNIEHPNLTLEYVMSSFANRPPVRRVDFTNDELCRPVRVDFSTFNTPVKRLRKEEGSF